jgi:DNA repair protein RadC
MRRGFGILPFRCKSTRRGLRDPTVVPSAPPYPLFVKDGDGFLEASEPVVLECARRLACAKLTDGGAEVRNTEALYDFLLMQLGARDHEVFAVLLLDSNRKLIEYVELFHGTTEYVSVHIREVLKWMVATRASHVVVAHNHPSGNSAPSSADICFTGRIKQALAHIDVQLLNHLVVGRSITSLRQIGRYS